MKLLWKSFKIALIAGLLWAPALAQEARWVEVRLPDDRRAWAPREALLTPSERPLPPAGVVDLARRLLGTPYRWGGSSPNGADCSGYVQEVFRLAGYSLPRRADEQYRATVEVDREALRPGDLVFFSIDGKGPSHVGIYAGDRRFLHASSSRGVTESDLAEDYYARRFLGGRRLPAWQGREEGSPGDPPPDVPPAKTRQPEPAAAEPWWEEEENWKGL